MLEGIISNVFKGLIKLSNTSQLMIFSFQTLERVFKLRFPCFISRENHDKDWRVFMAETQGQSTFKNKNKDSNFSIKTKTMHVYERYMQLYMFIHEQTNRTHMHYQNRGTLSQQSSLLAKARKRREYLLYAVLSLFCKKTVS